MSTVDHEMPIASTAMRDCIAYDRQKQPIGRYRVSAGECLVPSPSAYNGWFWSITRAARAGRRFYPQAHSYGYDPLETRELVGIGAGWRRRIDA